MCVRVACTCMCISASTSSLRQTSVRSWPHPLRVTTTRTHTVVFTCVLKLSRSSGCVLFALVLQMHPSFGLIAHPSSSTKLRKQKFDNARSSNSICSRPRTPTNRFVKSALSRRERHYAESIGNDFARCSRGRSGALSRRPRWFVSHPTHTHTPHATHTREPVCQLASPFTPCSFTSTTSSVAVRMRRDGF